MSTTPYSPSTSHTKSAITTLDNVVKLTSRGLNQMIVASICDSSHCPFRAGFIDKKLKPTRLRLRSSIGIFNIVESSLRTSESLEHPFEGSERVHFVEKGLGRCQETALTKAMALQLNTSFLPGSLASRLSSDLQFCSCSNSGVRQGQLLVYSDVYTTTKASCHSTDKQEVYKVWVDCTPTRRHVLKLARQVATGAGAAFIMPRFSSARAEPVKRITNIEDARVAGEKAREIKEAADGPVIVSSSGIKYRELERGVGKPISPGDYVSVYYTISRLNGYYLDSMGYGKEGKNDVGEALTFQYGKGMVPEAVEGGMEGMQVGAKRRILVTPERGWVRPELLPQPTSFFAERRLSDRRTTQALLIEVELVKAKPINE